MVFGVLFLADYTLIEFPLHCLNLVIQSVRAQFSSVQSILPLGCPSISDVNMPTLILIK